MVSHMKRFLLFSVLFTSASLHAGDKPYTIAERIPLSGGEGWDLLAVEPNGERLFVTRSNHVDVIDVADDYFLAFRNDVKVKLGRASIP